MNLGQYHHKLKGADFPLWKPICKVWPKVVESGFEGKRPLIKGSCASRDSIAKSGMDVT